MLDVATIVGSIVGIIGGVAGVVSSVNQHRQTRIMEIGLERAIEAPEGEAVAGQESKFTALVNKRVNDTRRILRDEYRPRLAEIERVLRDSHIAEYTDVLGKVFKQLDDAAQDGARIKSIAEEASKVQNEIGSIQESIRAETGKNTGDIDALEHEVEELQQQIENMRKGIGVHDSVLKRMRLIAEQLLQITSQPETAWRDARIELNDVTNQHEMARQDAMVKPNEKLGPDGVANQGEIVGQDWKMERDETAGHDNLYGYGG